MIKKLLGSVVAQKQSERRAELYRNLIRHEAKIGGQLFGPVPAGGRREFFCLDEHTWVWHEEWTDSNGQIRAKTTRYDLRPDGTVIKAQDGQPHKAVSDQEAIRLYQAMCEYERRVNTELYGAIA
jgi:hypothetical protein